MTRRSTVSMIALLAAVLAAAELNAQLARPSGDPRKPGGHDVTSVESTNSLTAVAGALLAAHTCSRQDQTLVCEFVLTSQLRAAKDFSAGSIGRRVRAFDDQLREYAIGQARFLDRNGEPMTRVNLLPRQAVTLVLAVPGFDNSAQQARFQFGGRRGENVLVPVR